MRVGTAGVHPEFVACVSYPPRAIASSCPTGTVDHKSDRPGRSPITVSVRPAAIFSNGTRAIVMEHRGSPIEAGEHHVLAESRQRIERGEQSALDEVVRVGARKGADYCCHEGARVHILMRRTVAE